MQNSLKLDPEKVIATISKLEGRIADRFPDSGLQNVCGNFLQSARSAVDNIRWINLPHIPLRIFSATIILIGLGGLVYSITYVDLTIEDNTLANIVTISEAIFNDLVLLGAAVFFLLNIESRVKRKRALQALNDLRVVAHVIDMHQLTKDPMQAHIGSDTANSPKRNMTDFELQRYLDYCSELCSLVAKVAALYSQSLADEVVVKSVNEIEVLCAGLSRKIWQKIMILDAKPRVKE